MNILSDSELAAIDRNHSRLARIGDVCLTANLFASLDAEAARSEAASAQARHDASSIARQRAASLRSCGADLPLFA